MKYSKNTFIYPNFVKKVKNNTDSATFFDCDFSAVQTIDLSGFEFVVFSGWNTVLRPSSKIEITNCKSVLFENVPFQEELSTLNITDAGSITFDGVTSTYKMKLQTQNCGAITYRESTLNFDTSNVHAKRFEISRSQIARINTLDFTGITEQFQLNNSNVFDLKEMIINKNVKRYISSTYDAKQILDPITKER